MYISFKKKTKTYSKLGKTYHLYVVFGTSFYGDYDFQYTSHFEIN